ncbi:MAG: hypothetical protein COV45_05390 [Deltaproteobacteria bacterium CG11_big_fil_rev_8_21_14_0_20_47_16]|nr:MAG: hypothetical protein COV45_05390 [Deltaproteobacteria bacterium CG11_big_fil_rev_8_21_14_0_20_47_16]
MTELRVSPILSFSDIHHTQTSSTNIPGVGTVVTPFTGTPTIRGTGIRLDGSVTITRPSPWISLEAGLGAAASYGLVNSYSANAGIGAKLHLPNDRARAFLNLGVAGWKLLSSDDNVTTLGASIAFGVEAPLSDRLAFFVDANYATNFDLSQTAVGAGLLWRFGRQSLPPIRHTEDVMNIHIGLENAAHVVQQVKALFGVSMARQIETFAEKNTVEERVLGLVTYFRWVSGSEGAGNLLAMLPSLTKVFGQIDHAVGLASSTSNILLDDVIKRRIDDLKRQRETILPTLAALGIDYLHSEKPSIMEQLISLALKTLQTIQSEATAEVKAAALKSLKTAVIDGFKVVEMLGSEQLKPNITPDRMQQVEKFKAVLNCIQTGKACDKFPGFPTMANIEAMEKTLPSL